MKRLSLLILCCLVWAVMPAKVQLSVSLDSAYIIMGNLTPLRVKLVTPEGDKGNLMIPRDSICGGVEIHSLADFDTSSIGNGLVEITGDIMLQSFDSGLYRLNPIYYVEGNETIASNRPALKVVPVDVDSLATIHDYADAQDVERKFIDYIPDFIIDYGLWLVALLIACGAGWWVWSRFFRKQKQVVKAKVKPVPPYELAVGELNKLHSESLCEQGREREFYTRLTDILRNYLQGRFGINALEMTSSQIRQAVRSHSEAAPEKEYMDQVLEIADFVKFAKMRPLPDDNVRAFNSAMKFVNDTKPVPVAEKPAEDQQEPKQKP